MNRALRDAGVPTGVLFAPVIPALNDHELDSWFAGWHNSLWWSFAEWYDLHCVALVFYYSRWRICPASNLRFPYWFSRRVLDRACYHGNRG